ncbi:FkbM family methyltransferase [Caenimonas sp. SL110]|uniref:FkbM family methyltransferase n=1 Tax=Caenimonas sp. SL110 TaxID=1450524 RepID=UPI00069CDC23|nr:FkbM family methyltransferase [Caenimonas sp. SL110]
MDALEKIEPHGFTGLDWLFKLYPFYKGRGRLALSSLFRGRSPFGRSESSVRLLTGEAIFVVDDDYIGRMLRFFGDLDPAVTSTMRRLVRTGDTVLDIGANVGAFSLPAATIVGQAGSVYAFEPVTRLCSLLQRSVAANEFKNIRVMNVALSDFRGEGTMAVAAAALGCSSLTRGVEGETCKVEMLDEVDFGPAFSRPRLIKIDVEGHEASVLSGGRGFLERYRPEFVLFESHDNRGDFWDREEVRILTKAGYRFSVIERTPTAKPVIRQVAIAETKFAPFYDFLATS